MKHEIKGKHTSRLCINVKYLLGDVNANSCKTSCVNLGMLYGVRTQLAAISVPN